MTDIVERLRDMFVRFGGENNDDSATRRVKTAKEAADEIEKLRAERDALREAVAKYVETVVYCEGITFIDGLDDDWAKLILIVSEEQKGREKE